MYEVNEKIHEIEKILVGVDLRLEYLEKLSESGTITDEEIKLQIATLSEKTDRLRTEVNELKKRSGIFNTFKYFLIDIFGTIFEAPKISYVIWGALAIGFLWFVIVQDGFLLIIELFK